MEKAVRKIHPLPVDPHYAKAYELAAPQIVVLVFAHVEFKPDL